MIKIGKAKRSVMAVSILAFSVQSAFAYTVNVNSSIPISTQVMPALSTANGLLGNIQATLINIGTAISQQGDRQAALMQQVAETNRQFEVEQKRNDRLLQAGISTVFRMIYVRSLLAVAPRGYPLRPLAVSERWEAPVLRKMLRLFLKCRHAQPTWMHLQRPKFTASTATVRIMLHLAGLHSAQVYLTCRGQIRR